MFENQWAAPLITVVAPVSQHAVNSCCAKQTASGVRGVKPVNKQWHGTVYRLAHFKNIKKTPASSHAASYIFYDLVVYVIDIKCVIYKNTSPFGHSSCDGPSSEVSLSTVSLSIQQSYHQFLLEIDKAYRVTVRLGSATEEGKNMSP